MGRTFRLWMKSQKHILEKSAESVREPAEDICVWVTMHLNSLKITHFMFMGDQ